jgi:hypothetical protein
MILYGGICLPLEKDTPCEHDSCEYEDKYQDGKYVHMPQSHRRLGLGRSGGTLNTTQIGDNLAHHDIEPCYPRRLLLRYS